jgi:hypothetical protein
VFCVRAGVSVIDKGAEILGSEPVAFEISFVVPFSFEPHWSAKMATISFVQCHPDIAHGIRSAFDQEEQDTLESTLRRTRPKWPTFLVTRRLRAK